MSATGLEGAIELSSGPSPLGVLAFRGADAARYLQGQLSAEIEKLAPGSSTLAGYHNPQGRVIALLAVTRAATDEFFAVLPRELCAGVAQRLGKFVLRAKVRIAEESQSWRVLGVNRASVSGVFPTIPWGARHLQLVPEAGGTEAPAGDPVLRAAWERADVAGGLPQVYAATSESFVAQMLNLDLLGAIAFDKGCYTGQEVIARAHYRGRVKRRLQRWHNLSGTRLEPGQSAHGPDGRSLVVVRTAPDGGFAQELLAVGTFEAADASAEEKAAGKPVAGETPEAAAPAGPRLSGPLSLPYPLPS